MPHKFEQLEVWQISLQYIDEIYKLAERLPRNEDYNLRSQIIRAVTSIALNIAEGSTGQTNTEQARFLGIALRSVVETVACLRLITRRGYVDETAANQAEQISEKLLAKLQALRNSVSPNQQWVRE